MASNTLTGLTQTLYQALDVVANEKTGFIGSVSQDVNADMVALNQVVRSAVAPASTATNITPGAYSPDSGAQTLSYKDVTISKNRMVPINWTGDEQKSLGSQYNTVIRDQFAQAFRTIRNEIETDLAAAAVLGGSRAFGTAGTTPFAGTDLQDIAAMARILDDNGTPDGDRSLIVSSATMANLRGKNTFLFKANEAGSAELLRQGVVADLEGFYVRNTRQSTANTAGTGASYVIDGTGNTAAGSTVLKLKTGSGTILAGNVLTIGNFKYVVQTALSGALVTIAAPGLQAAVADGDTVTVAATYTGNIAMHKSAIQLVMRQPLMPEGGDGASDVMALVDPRTGLIFQVAMYKQYRQVHFEVGAAWGQTVVKPEFVGLLLG